MDRSLVEQLNRALNESDACGLRYEPQQREARLLMEVLALPADGPVHRDPRRALILSGVVSILGFVLRDRVDDPDASLPIASFDGLEEFFASLRWSHSMYGWEFIDVEDPRQGFPAQPSLELMTSEPRATHSLRWFTERGRDERQGPSAYLLGGISGLTASASSGPTAALDATEFAADGGRWWDASTPETPAAPSTRNARMQFTRCTGDLMPRTTAPSFPAALLS